MRQDKGNVHVLAEEIMLLEQDVARHISRMGDEEVVKEIGRLMSDRTQESQGVLQTVVTLQRHNNHLRHTREVTGKPANLLMKAIRIAKDIERTQIVSLKLEEAEVERQIDDVLRKIEGMGRRSYGNNTPVSTMKKFSLASPRLQLKASKINSRKVSGGLG